MSMTGSAGLSGVGLSEFTASYKRAFECGIADVLSSDTGEVECDWVNVTSVSDVFRRRKLFRDMSQDVRKIHMQGVHSASSGVHVAFIIRVLLEEIGLNLNDGVDIIKARLDSAQASGQLTSKTNQILRETLGNKNFSAIAVENCASGEVVLEVLRTASPSLQPSSVGNLPSQRNGNDGDVLYIALGAGVGGGILVLAGVVAALFCRRNKDKHTVRVD